ncbi:MAG: hypothetical protein U5N10_10725 [Gemmobacter sp.]|nr:hypothetical protein [Gemmobacter sp.]
MRGDLVPRAMLQKIQAILRESPDLVPRYELAKQVIRIFRRPAFYEISQRCNLWCEGCYYYENEQRLKVAIEPDLPRWDDFFRAEAERGVSMAYFVGAEPALERSRLLAAARHLRHGKIGTNGTIRLDPDITFRIGVSVWGDDETDAHLRGGSVLRKALRNYAGDARAVMLFTLSPWNLHTVPQVMQACRDHGLPVTFSLFSPTRTYGRKIEGGSPADGQFFRIAPEQGAAHFTADDLRRTADAMTGAMADFPDIALCSPAFRDIITHPGPLFDIDPDTHVARDCGSRIVGALRYHSTALRAEAVKCCTPDVNCADCRIYSGAWSSQFRPAPRFLESTNSFVQWLDMMEMLGRIFIHPLPDIYRQAGKAA